MSGQRRYPEGVRAALHVLCGGGCYRPECGEPAIRLVDGVPEINLEIAHIHALEDDGPRGISWMPVPERNAITNLIWLCGPCHKRVDADEQTYTDVVLKRWKRDREAQPLGRLAGLRDLDIAGMEELLRRAMTDIRNDMAAFTETFPDLASLLRETIEGLPSLDPESLHILRDAATRLDLPEYAPIMHNAATRLDLPDYALMVQHSAMSLELPDYAPLLLQAARELDLPTQVPRMRDAAGSLQGTVDSLRRVVARAADAARQMESAAASAVSPGSAELIGPVRYVRRVPLKAACILLLGWAITALLIYLHVNGRY